MEIKLPPIPTTNSTIFSPTDLVLKNSSTETFWKVRSRRDMIQRWGWFDHLFFSFKSWYQGCSRFATTNGRVVQAQDSGFAATQDWSPTYSRRTCWTKYPKKSVKHWIVYPWKSQLLREVLSGPHVAPALQQSQRELEKHQLQDKLEHKISDRPKPEQLVEQGILTGKNEDETHFYSLSDPTIIVFSGWGAQQRLTNCSHKENKLITPLRLHLQGPVWMLRKITNHLRINVFLCD